MMNLSISGPNNFPYRTYKGKLKEGQFQENYWLVTMNEIDIKGEFQDVKWYSIEDKGLSMIDKKQFQWICSYTDINYPTFEHYNDKEDFHFMLKDLNLI